MRDMDDIHSGFNRSGIVRVRDGAAASAAWRRTCRSREGDAVRTLAKAANAIHEVSHHIETGLDRGGRDIAQGRMLHQSRHPLTLPVALNLKPGKLRMHAPNLSNCLEFSSYGVYTHQLRIYYIR